MIEYLVRRLLRRNGRLRARIIDRLCERHPDEARDVTTNRFNAWLWG